MPSRAHKMLCDLIARKMQEEGFIPVAFDGRHYVVEGEEVHVPPTIGRHRPDVLGIDPRSRSLCIGEAKTGNDLGSSRTKEQFLDYAGVIGASTGIRVRLIIGVTSTMKKALLSTLKELGLDGMANISYVLLPEELVDSGQEI